MTRKTAPRKIPSDKPAARAKAKAARVESKAKLSSESAPKRHQSSPAKPSPKVAKSKPTVAPVAAARDSKQAQLIASLRAAAGVTIAQMMALTGWQAHSVRGAISGVLRKKLGLNVTCTPSGTGGERLYRIVKSAASATSA